MVEAARFVSSHVFSPWLNIGPEALYWIAQAGRRNYGSVKEIYITENGLLIER